jgi:CO dehydrogenase maturation factor
MADLLPSRTCRQCVRPETISTGSLALSSPTVFRHHEHMRIAIAGKGGAGKTTFAAATARLLARGGAQVVAIDADTNPNLAAAMGFDLEQVAGVPILPTTIVSRRLDGSAALRVPLDSVLHDHSTVGPDGVRLIRMGMPDHAQEGCLCSAHAAGSALFADLGSRPDTWTIMDLEASPEHLSRGTARHADALILVAEPYFRSLEAVRLQARLAAELPGVVIGAIANKLRTPGDAEAVSEFIDGLGIPLWGSVPWSDDVTHADRDRLSLLDAAPTSSAVDGIRDIVAVLKGLTGLHGSTCRNEQQPCA